MATIASLNVNLGIGSAAFTKGLKSARGQLSNFTSGLTSAKGLIGGFAAALGVGFSISAFTSWVSGAMDAIDANNDLAKKVGVTNDALIKLQHAAQMNGSSAEAMNAGLTKMSKNLGDAATKGGPAADALKTLGLDANELSKMAPDQAFTAIADGIAGIDNSSVQASTAVALFGKSGQELLNVLRIGADGLAEAGAEAEKLGIALSDTDAEQVAAAKDALDNVSNVLSGIAGRIAVELAPFIEAAASKLIEMATAGDGMGVTVGAALEFISKGVAFLADMWDVLKLGFLGVQYIIVKGLAIQASQVAQVAKLFGKFVALFGKKIDTSFFDSLADGLHHTADDIGKQFEQTLIGPSSGEKVAAFFDEIRSSAKTAAEGIVEAKNSLSEFDAESFAATTSANELVTKLQEQIATFGKSSEEVELWKLKQQGADEAVLKTAESLMKQLQVMEAAKQTIADNVSPLETFEKQRKALQEQLASGRITQQIFDRALFKAGSELAGSLNKPGDKPGRAAGVEFGSRESFDDPRDKGPDQQLQTLQQILDAARAQARSSAAQEKLFRESFKPTIERDGKR